MSIGLGTVAGLIPGLNIADQLLERILERVGLPEDFELTPESRTVLATAVDEFLERGAIPRVTAHLDKDDHDVEHVQPKKTVRSAIFWIIREFVPSGDVADLIRDKWAKKLVPILLPKLCLSAAEPTRWKPGMTLRRAVEITAEGIVEHIFRAAPLD